MTYFLPAYAAGAVLTCVHIRYKIDNIEGLRDSLVRDGTNVATLPYAAGLLWPIYVAAVLIDVAKRTLTWTCARTLLALHGGQKIIIVTKGEE